MRIRTIKPEFWANVELSSVSETACLLAIGLLNFADDEGYFIYNEKLINSTLFPIREGYITTPVALQELLNIEYIKMFTPKPSVKIGLVVNFKKHQVINHPTPSKIKCLALPERYRNDPVAIPSRARMEGKGREGNVHPHHVEVDEADEAEFQLFISAYPSNKRRGLQEIKKAWATMTATERQSSTKNLPAWLAFHEWKKEGGRFIPQALAYLIDRIGNDPPPGESNLSAAPKNTERPKPIENPFRPKREHFATQSEWEDYCRDAEIDPQTGIAIEAPSVNAPGVAEK